jgi:hypothetical protein
VNDTIKIAGLGLLALIFFVIGMVYSGGTPNQILVAVTVNPDGTAQAAVLQSVDYMSTFTSEGMETEIAGMVKEEMYNIQATQQITFQTAVANGYNVIYPKIQRQLRAEGVNFKESPTPSAITTEK